MADEIELFKASVQGTTEGLTAPFAKLIDEIFGKAATQIGLALEDRAKEYRERQRRFLERSKEMLDRSGKQPGKIPLNLLGPIIQNGSLEEDHYLQDRWAALLAGAATGSEVPGAFIEILKQLTCNDVELLQLCYDHIRNIEITVWKPEDDRIRAGAPMPPPPPFDPTGHDLTPALGKWKWQLAERLNHHWIHTGKYGQPDEFHTYLDNVIRLGLITPADVRITRIGYRFISACQIGDC